MPDQYYLAIKGCSMGLQERVLLSVDKNKEVRFHRGHNSDKFELNDEGKLFCSTSQGYSLSYNIQGPLTEKELREACSINIWSGQGRVRSARTTNLRALGSERYRGPIGGND